VYKRQGFIYQLVNNKSNSVDVDKLDYISRDTQSLGLEFGGNFARIIDGMKVINNTICFPEKISYDIVSLFVTRYRLHKQVYNNKAVISTQLMLNKIIIELDNFLDIYVKIYAIDNMIDLTDDFVTTMTRYILKNPPEKLTEKDKTSLDIIKSLWDRLNRRELFKIVEMGVSKDFEDHKKNLNIALEKHARDDILIRNCKIGFVSGDKNNPLDNILFYKKGSENAKTMKKEDMSVLLPIVYQEYIYMLFSI